LIPTTLEVQANNRITFMKVKHNRFSQLLVLFFFLSHLQFITGQCAGEDATVTICEKDADSSFQNYNLFNVLGGTPTAGGIWSSNTQISTSALDIVTGEVNLWAITRFGTYEFTYTNSDCNESATITLNLGGYPGESNIDGSANACDIEGFVNLHRFIGSLASQQIQDFNGTWTLISGGPSSLLNDNMFDAFTGGQGEYRFTYFVPAFAGCSARQVELLLEVHRAPVPAPSSADIEVAIDEDLSMLTNVDLFTQIIGFEEGGVWTEGRTDEIDDEFDSFINVEAIRDTFGIGVYPFVYEIPPDNPVCPPARNTVNVIIEPFLLGGFGADSSSAQQTTISICPGEVPPIALNYDPNFFENGNYRVTLNISDENGIETIQQTITMVNGSSTVTIDRILQSGEFFTLQVVDITGANLVDFDDFEIEVQNVDIISEVSNITATNVCFSSDTDVTITITNATENGNPFTGESDVEYLLTFPDDAEVQASVGNVNFDSGTATFAIANNDLSLSGNYSLSIQNIDLGASCASTTGFTVIEIPEAIDLQLSADALCDATLLSVMIDAPVLPDGSYDIQYQIINFDTSAVQLQNAISFNGGVNTFDLDLNNLNPGNYIARIESSQNDTTKCRTQFEFSEQLEFVVGNVVNTTTIASPQAFCPFNFENNTPTLAAIETTAFGRTLFFESETSSSPLPMSTPLTNGTTYFFENQLSETCTASERIPVTINLDAPRALELANTTPLFCSTDNATLLEIVITPSNGGTILWYADEFGDDILPIDQPLENGEIYYAFEEIPDACENPNRLAIAPILIFVEPPQLNSNALSSCALENPTVADFDNLLTDRSQSIRWFDSETEGTQLNNSTALQDDTSYYAEAFDPDTGCINPNRERILVDVNDCDPQTYDFFIPDGFSPNGDGRNDVFTIPNIEIIFPDFTLEIFNRYGTTLFKGNSANPSWDGSSSGATVPNGLYFYIINFNREGHPPVQGRLYLNR